MEDAATPATPAVTLGGIHHLTAFASDPRCNLDFYARLLGLRLIQHAVDHDDSGTYYLAYGDGAGAPGSILSFLPSPSGRRGRGGTGQVRATGFAVPRASIGWWMDRLQLSGVLTEGCMTRFGDPVLSFCDWDGLRLELVGLTDPRPMAGWDGAPVSAEHAIRRTHSVTLWPEDDGRSATLLTGAMGFRRTGGESKRWRFEVGAGGAGAIVDLCGAPDDERGVSGIGTVHHVAFRAADDAALALARAALVAAGMEVTPVLDETYAHSIYFREPGGVLVGIATDGPGFPADAAPGGRLVLPPFSELDRAPIEDGREPLP